MVHPEKVTFSWGLLLLLAGCAQQTPGPGSTPDASAPCPAPGALCDGACVEVASDPANCGGCGVSCASGMVCTMAQCTATCGLGQTRCASGCVDVASDGQNCGACGHACGGSAVCAGGQCVAQCAAGQKACGATCVDVQTDQANCGGCGQVCAPDQKCAAGACALACNGGTVQCGAACVETQWDPSNCGGCGNGCATGQTCDHGACVGAGQGCQAPNVTCGAFCVNTATNPTNCGGCGVVCPVGDSCQGGACGASCAPPEQICGASCVDTSSNAAHCGGCGVACPAGVSCVASACVSSCPPNQTTCGATCVDLGTDPGNCGACGHTCGSSQSCQGGVCGPICPVGKIRCGSVCVDTLTDATNCGGCGTACGLYGACVGGSCALSCPAGLAACGGTCLDLGSSQLHCGACAHACSSGQLCASSVCFVPPPSVWQTVGADGQHSGHNPNETGRPPLAALWSHTMGSGSLWPVVFENGTLFAMKGGTLYALNPVDGSMKWTRALGNGSISNNVGMPTASGHVYAAESGNSGNTFLYIVDETTGALSQTFPFASQWETYWAPLVVGTKVYFDGGSYGGMYGYDTTTASQIFFTGLDQYDSWSPAVFKNVLYSFINGSFRALNMSTGVVQSTVSVPWTWNGYSMNTATVFGSKYAYIVSPPTLYAIDPVMNTTVWSDGASYVSMPAYANGRTARSPRWFLPLHR